MKETGREQRQNTLQSHPSSDDSFPPPRPISQFFPPPKKGPPAGAQVLTNMSLWRTFPVQSKEVEKVAIAEAIEQGKARLAVNTTPK